ncbi:fatty acid desaturase [Phenylobacterium sp.]|uniref:fatty acid desaturase family protein n=1 Tax=Phenylobacterium sp. TaxID=1871053 RepID=UPI00281142E3|nr:fatty acid desaturase [Phenylobacterium sp.]
MTAEALAPAPSLARLANDLTRDLMRPNPGIYWLDLVATAAVTYLSLWVAVTAQGAWAFAGAAVCVLALYRAVSFIHELTHQRRDELPGFHLGWNVLVGAPFLTPSLLYEGVHMLHHAKDRYGTVKDPEYMPLARLPLKSLLGFVFVALLAPVGVILRFAVLAPASFLIPRLRRWVVAKTSAMTINTAFAREDFERAGKAPWLAQEIACWLWSWTVIGLTAAGAVPLRAVLIAVGIYAVFAFVNQLRTAVAHYWENDGAKMSFEGQFLDSVNVPPPALLPFLWAPVGLRYHGLHHLLPRMPYHNLGKAHARLVAHVPQGHVYRQVEQPELVPALARLVRKPR